MNAFFGQQSLRQIDKKNTVIIGSISVLDETRRKRTIVVCQEISTYYHGNSRYRKTFHLESIDGLQVYQTEDPAVYRFLDGAKLKRCRQS